MLWMIAATLLATTTGGVNSSDNQPAELNVTISNCQLDVKDGNWAMECTTDPQTIKSTDDLELEFFCTVTLRGILNPELSVELKNVLRTYSLSKSEWYCEKSDSTRFRAKALNMLNLSPESIRNLKISNTSDPDGILNISYQYPLLKKLKISDYSFPELSTLPAHPNNSLTYLSLRDNKIESIADGIFVGFPRLKTLYLFYNRLKAVQKKMFDGINGLETLDLSYNLIESLPSDVFSNLQSLDFISLEYNSLTHISGDLFRFNKLLSWIDISGNKGIKNLPPTLFQNRFYLNYAFVDNCSLFDLDKDVFRNSPNLNTISFSYNNLNLIRADMFKPLKSLRSVGLRHNNISSLYETLSEEGTAKEVYDKSTPVFKRASKLRFLDLRDNKIELLEDRQISYFTDLQYLGLDRNKIEKVELGHYDAIRIDELSISENYITEFNVSWGKLFVKILKVDHNLLTCLSLPPCITDNGDKIIYNFTHNNISTVNIDFRIKNQNPKEFNETMSECGFTNHSVDISHNPLLCDCRLYPFYKYVNEKCPGWYQFVNLENLTCSDPPFLNKLPLVSLPEDAFNCPLFERCPLPCHCGIRGKDNLVFVNCSSMDLSEVPETFPPETAILYLNKNKLRSMDSLNAYAFSNLSELYLDDNSLTDMDGWKIPPFLKYLSVRGNSLKTLPRPLMKFISNLTDFQLFFGNNDKDCNCEQWKMKNFLLENSDLIKDNDYILCESTSNGKTKLLPLVLVPDQNLCSPNFNNNLGASINCLHTHIVILTQVHIFLYLWIFIRRIS